MSVKKNYCTGEPLETGDYELWAPNRVPSPSSPLPHPVASGMGFPPGGGLSVSPGSLPPSGGVGIPNPQLSSSAPPAHPNTIFSPVYAPRQKVKGRTRPAQVCSTLHSYRSPCFSSSMLISLRNRPQTTMRRLSLTLKRCQLHLEPLVLAN